MSDGSASIRVFISYSHDSDRHKNQALDLAGKLRSNGIEAWLDQYEAFPVQGWPTWMVKELKAAKFVLVVCSKTYQERFEGSGEAGKGLGGKFEGAIITQGLYESERENRKFIPVVFSKEDIEFRPTILRQFNYYDTSNEDSWLSLFRLLSGQPAVIPPAVGPLKNAPPDIGSNVLNTRRTVDRGRLEARVAASLDERGFTALLHVANVSSSPCFIETPQIVIENKGAAAPTSGTAVTELQSSFSLLPEKPSAGPIQPTERRTFFLPHNFIPLIANEHKRLGGRIYISIESGAGEEVRLDDDLSVRSIMSVLEYVGTTPRTTPSPTAAAIRQAKRIGDLVDKRMGKFAHQGYEVLPPQIVLDDPSILEAGDARTRLRGKNFKIRWPDKSEDLATFEELVAMTQQLIALAIQIIQLNMQLGESSTPPFDFIVQGVLNIEQIMRPESVKVVMSKLTLSNEPSD